MKKSTVAIAAVIALIIGAAVGVVGARLGQESATGGGLADIADARGFTGDQAEAALKTFVPPGEYDEYYIFSSGGHSGQVFVYGVPSMRLLKVIPVFTPDAWQGYGYGTDQGNTVLAGGTDPDKDATDVDAAKGVNSLKSDMRIVTSRDSPPMFRAPGDFKISAATSGLT